MTTQELHIEIQVLLQKINTHWNQSLLPQEIDLFLNREITKFINRRIDRLGNQKGTGLYDTIKRTVELSPLMKTVKVPVIYNTSQKEVKVLLPFDFLYYVSSEVSVCCTCKNLSIGDTSYYTAELPPIKDLGSFPILLRQGLYNISIAKEDIPEEYLIESTISMYSNKMLIVNALNILLQKKNNLEVDVKYDKVKDKFIFRSLSPFELAYVTDKGVGLAKVTSETYKGYGNFEDNDLIIADVIDEEFKTSVRKSYLSGAKPDRALAVLRDSEIFYTLNGVIGNYVNLTYICKPTKIDLLLQSNSELNDTVLEQIAADTAQKMMSVIGSDGYAKYVQENTIVE